MKNVDKLYEKYYSAYKNDYDTDELSETKKKKFGYRQFELFDKTDKKLTLDGDIKKFFKEIENQGKIVDEKKFKEDFSYEPTALVNNLLSQSMQDLRKSLNQIKQQNIKLNEDERNSTNNKNKNGKLNNIQFINFLSIHFFLSQQPDESNLPKWVKVSKQRFDVIKKKLQNAKNKRQQARPNRSKVINFEESSKLLHEIEDSKIAYEKLLKGIEIFEAKLIKLLVCRVST